jgi:IPT/TIG domain
VVHPLYDYGPPEVESDGGTPAGATGEVEDAGGGTVPHTPPANTATVVVPGGSPTAESGLGPTVSGVAPATAVINTSTPVSVNGANFSPTTKVTLDGAPLATVFVTTAQVRADLISSTAKTSQVGVVDGVKTSNTVAFTFTATE